MSDTIAAIATGNVLAGVGILRISGARAIEIADAVFTPAQGAPMSARESRRLVYGALHDAAGARIDLCLCTVSRAPHSYTGEDTAELQCHGSPTALRAGLQALYAAGARAARPGEFTKRAFLNGRMDLTQAEAVIDLIHAETPEIARNAAAQLGGAVREKTEAVYARLAEISSHYHAVIDYPDEDIEPFLLQNYAAALAEAEAQLSALERTSARGALLREGLNTAIVGRPNAGKSSLMNALLGFDRAIVSPAAGTTRDTISERVRFGGLLLNLIDTAGVRETRDALEALGVERAQQTIAQAGLILCLVDSAAPCTAEDAALLARCAAAAPTLLVRTKCDLPAADSLLPPLPAGVETVSLSARTGAGLDALERAVAALFPAPPAGAGEILTNARQADAVSRALASVRAAREAMLGAFPPDAVLTETEEAMAALGELSGRTLREDITEGIFSRFCVGK